MSPTEKALKEIGEALRRERHKQGLTIKQIAEKSGVAFNIISETETGKRPNLSLQVVLRIAAALKKPLKDLI